MGYRRGSGRRPLETRLARPTPPPRESRRRATDSVAVPRPVDPARPGETQKSQNRQRRSEQKRQHRPSLHPRLSRTHCARPDFAGYIWRYRLLVRCPFRTSTPIQQSAPIFFATSFAPGIFEPLRRQRKFPRFERSLLSIVRQDHAARWPAVFCAAAHSGQRTASAAILFVSSQPRDPEPNPGSPTELGFPHVRSGRRSTLRAYHHFSVATFAFR